MSSVGHEFFFQMVKIREKTKCVYLKKQICKECLVAKDTLTW